MEAGNGRVNLGGGSTTTNGNARPTTRRNPGRSANANQSADANVSAGTPPVDMGMMYQFFINLMQAGAAAGAVGGNAVNTGGANPVAPLGTNYAKLSRDFTSLGGKPFHGTENGVEVENWLLHCERIFADLGLNDEQKRRLASRQL